MSNVCLETAISSTWSDSVVQIHPLELPPESLACGCWDSHVLSAVFLCNSAPCGRRQSEDRCYVEAASQLCNPGGAMAQMGGCESSSAKLAATPSRRCCHILSQLEVCILDILSPPVVRTSTDQNTLPAHSRPSSRSDCQPRLCRRWPPGLKPVRHGALHCLHEALRLLLRR